MSWLDDLAWEFPEAGLSAGERARGTGYEFGGDDMHSPLSSERRPGGLKFSPYRLFLIWIHLSKNSTKLWRHV